MKYLLTMLLLCAGGVSMAQTPQPSSYTAGGRTIEAYDFAGFEKLLQMNDDKTYVVNFWATWCTPCVQELPYFEQLQEAYRDQKVEVILVSLDMAKQVESRLIPFLIKKDIRSRVVYLRNTDSGEWIGKVDPSWSGALPATVLYNARHRVFREQSFTYESLEKELKSILN
ncbi:MULTISPECIES: TlpA disulfide reductase family protein [unclassified Flavobacterium]|uniref:TlpA disulfide reductase family protein n=1 Tax=unclassified Flavobacterium TaxID=196869 RepID=UPI001F13CBCC|nr:MULTISPECIES: TlpA disulfide reductase family protein [unclassified Flavobacterium]UMY64505.1 TlpA family protein disulfide reductase [Flavobacterium sp. HJ-32-4]